MMNNIDNYEYKTFSEDLIDDLLYLFQEEGSSYTKDYIFSKYKYSLSDVSLNFVGYISYDQNKMPAAFIGGFPCKMSNESGKIFLALQIGDVITHPNHRRKGLFVKLASLFFDFLRAQKKFDLVFGFPNESLVNSYFNKLGWHKNDLLRGFVLKTGNINFYGFFHKTKIFLMFYRYYIKLIIQLLSIKKDFPRIIINGFVFKIVKDKEFYDYQFRYSKSHLLKIDSNIYFIKFIDGIQIDFFKINNLKEVKKNLKSMNYLFGVNKITTICTEKSNFTELLKNVGFVNSSYSINSGYLFLDDNLKMEPFEFSIIDTDDF